MPYPHLSTWSDMTECSIERKKQQCSMLWSASFRWALESKEHAPDRLAVGLHGENIKMFIDHELNISLCILSKDCVYQNRFMYDTDINLFVRILRNGWGIIAIAKHKLLSLIF